MNKETHDLRKMKPKREIQKDKADYLLECEKKVNYEQINIYAPITYESKFDCCISIKGFTTNIEKMYQPFFL